MDVFSKWTNQRLITRLRNILLFPLVLLRFYLAQMWIHLTVIKQTDQQQSPKEKINRTYMGTFLAFIFAAIHGIFGLHYESGLPFTLASLRRSPYLFWREAFIKPTWLQIDIIWLVTGSLIAIILLDFALKNPIAHQHLFTINTEYKTAKLGDNALSDYESTQLLAVFHRARAVYGLFGAAIYIFPMIYYYTMVFFVMKTYLVTVLTLSFWILIFPIMFGTFVFIVFVDLVHIIVSASTIQIRQQYLCQRFSRLLAILSGKRTSYYQFQSIWPGYLVLNRANLSICQQSEAFNRFFNTYLTLTLLNNIILQVMFAYVIFFGPIDETGMFILKCDFSLALGELIALLFGIINYCARVVKKNGQITRLNRRFAVHCFRHQRLYRLSIRQLLKIELFQWPRLLQFYAFKIFGGSRITSKTFYVMTINISGFFLFVTKRNYIEETGPEL